MIELDKMHEPKYKPIQAVGLIDSWGLFCNKKVSEGWTLQQAYKYYNKILHRKVDGKYEQITYDDFATISKTLFQKIVQYLILGEPYHLGNHNGNLQAVRIERNFKETKLSQLGYSLVPQYTGDKDLIRVIWQKPTKNSFGVSEEEHNKLRKYYFTAARDYAGCGLQERLRLANKHNPLLIHGYNVRNYQHDNTI